MFGISLKDKAVFFRQLATLIEAGVPLLQCIESVGKLPNRKVQDIARMVMPMIVEGKPLSEALAKFPSSFDDIIIMMIKAGEIGGSLEIRLNNIADYLERMSKMQQETITKMLYPIFLLHAGIFIPPIVKLVMGDVMGYLASTLIPLAVLYGVVIGFYVLYNTLFKVSGIALVIDTILMKLPFVGGFFRARSSYRFMMVLADLTDAGLDLETSVRVSADASGSMAAKAAFNRCLPCVQEGNQLSVCLRKAGVIPETALQMIATGEQAGSLPRMLAKSSEILEQDVNEATNRFFTFVPVILYLGIAAYIGFGIVTTFANIYPKELFNP